MSRRLFGVRPPLPLCITPKGVFPIPPIIPITPMPPYRGNRGYKSIEEGFFVYDSYGALAELHTFRDGLSGDADITTWTYDNATGLLTAKTDASGKSVTYTYDSANRLATRTWARGIATTYSYSPSTGELVSVDYSDDTPDISYTYNRVGQQKTVTDAVGTRTFAYNDKMQLTSESINGIYTKVIERSYSTTGYKGRYVGMNIGSEYDVDYGYDGYGRFSTVASGSDSWTYAYLANSNLVESVAYPNDISVVNTYEPHRNLVTSVENKHGSTTISKYDYSNDQLGRRVSMAKSGTAFTASDTISYGYNDRSEVVSAVSANDATYNYGFDFDTIGNRITATSTESNQSTTSTYTTNNLNQYVSITNPNQNPTYDPDGDMLTMTLNSGSWTNAFNAENRIVSMETADKKLEFVYDYMGRRVEKKVYSGSTDNWSLITDNCYVYDGYEQIEKLDALNSNAIRNKRIWSGGKIIRDIRDGVAYYALGDANKNRTEYIDSSGTIQGHYEYSPFGKITVKNGTLADDFDYRFSSEVFDTETGLSYYNYRYYSPELGRWLSRDPIGEKGGFNLYAMVGNDAVGGWDYLGLWQATKESKGKARRVYECTEEGDTLETLASIVKLAPDEADKWAIVIEKADDGTPCKVSVPNVWITANLMHGGDVVDWLINIGGAIGFSYKPDGVKEVIVSDITKLVPEIEKQAGKIYGLVIYAHGNKMGDISNTANHIWGSPAYEHTMRVLRALDKGGYQIAEAHPMQCYSTYKGRATVLSQNKSTWPPNRVRKSYEDVGLVSVGAIIGPRETELHYNVDWQKEWNDRVVKDVDGYFGPNILGIDF